TWLRQPSRDHPPGGVDRLVAVVRRLHGRALAVAHQVARPQLHDQLGPVADPLPSILKLELERDADEPQDDAVDLHACQKAPVADAPVPMAIPWADSWETPRMMAPPTAPAPAKGSGAGAPWGRSGPAPSG